MFGMGIPTNTHKRHASEIITSVILKQNNQTDLKDFIKNFKNKINNKQKELFFDSFSEVKVKNIITNNTNLNSADNSMMELNNKDILENFNTNRYTNKSMVNSIINRFHDLYMKLIGKYKKIKIENNNLKKNLKTANSTNSPNENINGKLLLFNTILKKNVEKLFLFLYKVNIDNFYVYFLFKSV